MHGMVVRATQAQGTATHDRHKSAEKWDVWSLSPNLIEVQKFSSGCSTLWMLQMETADAILKVQIERQKHSAEYIFLFYF